MFDALIPIHMPPEAGFAGESGRGGLGFNGEIAFAFGAWAASLHKVQDARYMIVRLGLGQDEATRTVPELIRRIARASAVLDVSIRPAGRDIVVLKSGQRAVLKQISLFPAGEMPYIDLRGGSFSIEMPVEMFSDALMEDGSQSDERAVRMFADVDFEATTESRFVVLSTIVELLAERRSRDPVALGLVDRWIEEAISSSREDLAQALTSNMRTESTASAIRHAVGTAAARAGCREEVIVSMQKKARDANRKRGALLHRGTSVSVAELSELRAVVRLLLVGATEGTPFTPIGNRLWAHIDD